ncbi:translation initiation factor eIF 4e-like domain-containing protein [Flammula alnicola]|nr:translation initiation factor eIF 4e-like domain-containing protein [Flammula alnicola]
MANYFSNHSSSRFLANSSQTATTTTATQPTAATAAATSQPAPLPPTAPRSRIPSSKHFSTTVNTSQPAASKDPAATSTPPSATATQVHPLRNTWVFWFRQQRAPGNKIISYEEGIKKIAAFSSVESFWSLWTHLSPPSSLQPTTDYLLFHTGIRRPVWEDPLNLQGGKWIIRLKKGIADRFWEDLVMAIIGDQFDDCRSKQDGSPKGKSTVPVVTKSEDGSETSTEWPEICGCTISVRQSEDIVTVWNKVDGDPKLREQIRDTLRKVLNLPPSTIMEYKSNNDSMQDKSSFRRTAIDKTPLSSAS